MTSDGGFGLLTTIDVVGHQITVHKLQPDIALYDVSCTCCSLNDHDLSADEAFGLAFAHAKEALG